MKRGVLTLDLKYCIVQIRWCESLDALKLSEIFDFQYRFFIASLNCRVFIHLCPEMTLIRCTLNFDIQHEVSLKV